MRLNHETLPISTEVVKAENQSFYSAVRQSKRANFARKTLQGRLCKEDFARRVYFEFIQQTLLYSFVESHMSRDRGVPLWLNLLGKLNKNQKTVRTRHITIN